MANPAATILSAPLKLTYHFFMFYWYNNHKKGYFILHLQSLGQAKLTVFCLDFHERTFNHHLTNEKKIFCSFPFLIN